MRNLSRLSARRELSPLGTLVHSGSAADCSNENMPGSIVAARSYSTEKTPSQGQSRTRDSKHSRRTNQETQHSRQRVPKTHDQSILKSVENQLPEHTVTLSEAARHITFLAQRLSELGTLPPVWSAEATKVDSAEVREACFDDAQMLVQRIEYSVNTQKLNPMGKHGRELSHLLGHILEIYSQTAVQTKREVSIFDACCIVLTLLQEWNLDIQPYNYACAVEVAARESRWKEAAYLFWEQIDPDAHGYTPMGISRHLAVGLYVIARNSQTEGGSAVEHVMDAVLRMSMVCPTDQDKCKYKNFHSSACRTANILALTRFSLTAF